MKQMQPQQLTVLTAQQFIESFNLKMKDLMTLCKDLEATVSVNPNIFDEIIRIDSRFNYNMLESMRKVGAGELYCELLFDPSLAARRLLTLPPQQQRHLYNEPVRVVKLVGDKKVVEEKYVRNMSQHELTMVIDKDKGRARTVEEQLAFVKPAPNPKSAQRYEFRDGKLIVPGHTEFTMSQLEDILNRMKQMAIEALAKK